MSTPFESDRSAGPQPTAEPTHGPFTAGTFSAETTPPSSPFDHAVGAAPGTATAATPHAPAVGTFAHFWATRPVRLPKKFGGGGKVAGVCEGLGVRYQIDPTILRIVLVIATLFGGAGFIFYSLAWLTLPRYGSSLSPFEALSKRAYRDAYTHDRKVAVWNILFLGLSLSSFVGGPGSDWPLMTMASTAAIIAGGVGLYKMTPQPPAQSFWQRTAPAAPAADTTAAQEPVDGPAWAPTTGDGRWIDPQTGATTPPAWDPLGAAPFAWDLPEPSEVIPPAAPTKRRAPWYTLAMISLSMGTGVVAYLLTASLAVALLATGAVALGAGIVGFFFRRGLALFLSGLVLLFSGTATGALSAAYDDDFQNALNNPDAEAVQFTDAMLVPLNAADIPDGGYSADFAALTVDMRDFATTSDITIPINAKFSGVTLYVPDHLQVEFVCDSRFDDSNGCTQAARWAAENPGPENAPTVTFELTARFADIEVVTP